MKATHRFSVATLTLAALLASAAHASASNVEPIDARPIDALKRLYFVCERASANGTLSAAGVAYCSKVYEELTIRAFGGNFEKLAVWARTHRQGNEPRWTSGAIVSPAVALSAPAR
jgi:hypothetical protein